MMPINDRAMGKLEKLIGNRRPEVVPVHSIEASGTNALPHAYAIELGDRFNLPVNTEIVQANRPFRTGEGAAYRMQNRAEFAGKVSPADHLLVDDAVTMGGTLADLHSHVAGGGGNTLGATSLMASPYSHIPAPTQKTLSRLRDKLPQLESWWKKTYGYGFEGLTDSEAKYLTRFNSTDAVRDRFAPAGSTQEGRSNARDSREPEKAAGGGIARKANGGGVFSGYIHGTTGGRTDNKDIAVGSGSYVVPADILSGLGQGNRLPAPMRS